MYNQLTRMCLMQAAGDSEETFFISVYIDDIILATLLVACCVSSYSFQVPIIKVMFSKTLSYSYFKLYHSSYIC